MKSQRVEKGGRAPNEIRLGTLNSGRSIPSSNTSESSADRVGYGFRLARYLVLGLLVVIIQEKRREKRRSE